MELGPALEPVAALAPPAGAPAAPEPTHLSRGSGLLVLLPHSWSGRAKQLAWQVKLGTHVYSHASLGMLTARKGLSLPLSQQQQIPVKVALDYVSSGSSSSSWSSQAVNLPHSAHLLLWAQPMQAVPGRISSADIMPGYQVLYGEAFSQQAVYAALGECLYSLCQPIQLSSFVVVAIKQSEKRLNS